LHGLKTLVKRDRRAIHETGEEAGVKIPKKCVGRTGVPGEGESRRFPGPRFKQLRSKKNPDFRGLAALEAQKLIQNSVFPQPKSVSPELKRGRWNRNSTGQSRQKHGIRIGVRGGGMD